MRKTTITMLCALFFTFITAQPPCPPSQIKGIHTVQSGETLFGISRKYKVSVEQIRQWNRMETNDILQACVQLKVAHNATLSVAEDVPQNYNTQVVVSSKSVEETPEEDFDETIIKTNSVQPKTNNFGTPNFAYFRKSPYLPFFHVVSQSETLEGISRIYGLTMGEIMMMNNFSNNTRLATGQRLLLEDRNRTRMADYVFDEANYSSMQPTAQTSPQSYNQSSRLKPQPAFEDNQPEIQPKQVQNPVPKSLEKEPKKQQSSGTLSSNTAMTSEELDMVKEINLVRGNPAAYIPYIQDYINHLKITGDMGNSISTAQELINELKQTRTLSTLQPLQCVYIAAKKHGEDQKRRGDTDHQGSDGSWPWDRVKRECSDLQDGNENLVGGPASIRRAVILLLVDDGIEGRGHRKTTLNPDWKYVACYKMGTVGSMPNCWVQKYGY